MAKRVFDLVCVVPGLMILAPLFAVVACWITWDSPGPVFFRQVRVGKDEKPFRIYKFRTMVVDAERRGGQITVGQDARLTRSGPFLRKYKLDELPQLINVVKGEMSLVGPRPEVPQYVAYYPESVKKRVLSLPPGITDEAAIHFRNESALLAQADDPHAFYVQEILPVKWRYYQAYVDHRSLWRDFLLIVKTCTLGKAEHV